MQKANIFVCFNKSFLIPTVVMLESLMENCSNNRRLLINLVVEKNTISDTDLNKLNMLFKKFSVSFVIKEIDPGIINCFFTSRHVSKDAYFRLLLPKIFPRVKKGLYLDGDLIILHDVLELFDIKLNGKVLGAVKKYDYSGNKELGLTERHNYFNSGVLLIDFDKWRKKNLTSKLLKFLSKKKLDFYDQDALNFFLNKDFKQLPLNWNVLSYIYSSYNKSFPVFCKDKKFKLIHFNGVKKPWVVGGWNPYSRKFFHYLAKTPYKKMIFLFMFIIIVNRLFFSLISFLRFEWVFGRS